MTIKTINFAFVIMVGAAIMAFLVGGKAHAQAPLSHRDQAMVVDQLLEKRVQQLLPVLMRRADIDMWVLISREYNEDPVLRTLLPSDWFSARRRTMLVLFDRGVNEEGEDLGIEALAVARYDVGSMFKKAWNPEQQPDQWGALREIIAKRTPQRIGVNKSVDFAQADGLAATDYQLLQQTLPENYRQRLVSAEQLAVGWLETRIAEEIPYYQHAVAIAQGIIAEGFSDNTVTIGETTTTDLEWWFLAQIKQRGLSAWFPPTVTLQRQGESAPRMANKVIRAGDLLHVDLGLTYLRLNTDTQQHAYVLKTNETQAPTSLTTALAQANQLQDTLTKQFAVGRSGNTILHRTRSQALKQQLRPLIYSHPIGYYGHGSGPTIGMWDNQEGVAGSGDYPMYANTAYSIELSNTRYSEEWQQDVTIMLEEDAFFDGERVDYLNGRQLQFHLIRE